MSQDPKYLQIVIASPLRRRFDYLPSTGLRATDYPVGCRVEVPFGKRQLVGYVVGLSNQSSIKTGALKSITQRFDDNSNIRQQLDLLTWISDYYQHPLGDTLFSLLPNAVKKAAPAIAYQQRCWQISIHGRGLNGEALGSAPKQRALLNFLRDQANPQNDAALKAAGHSSTIALALEKKQLIERSQSHFVPDSCQSLLQGQQSSSRITLNAEQQSCLDTVLAMNKGTLLLEGITGSGKTEVYLQAIEQVLANGQQAIVLVPEIGLTPQTISRFTKRFNARIAVLHSSLNERERLAAWLAARDGSAQIVIGTRSAITTPLQQPGIIIVDEEHDSSYKQQEGLRYHARDVAVMRGQLEKIPVLLGSATPSLESLHNAQSDKYLHGQLTQRAGNASLPDIETVDIRHIELHHGLSENALQAISQTLDNHRQAMVFINRRGYSPLLICHDCGWFAQCSHCDARLTLHRGMRQLRCHHCDAQNPIPSTCPNCQSTRLLGRGQGTERSAEALQTLYPNYPVLRIDADTTTSKSAMDKQLHKINQAQPMILVGTQMLAKGHHFKALDTVVILDVDQGLYHSDFRAAEKTLQLLTQVAGRAGRSTDPGRVLIQTHLPDHPVLTHWLEQGYHSSALQLLNERKSSLLPPFGFLALIRADSSQAGSALNFLQQLRQQLSQNSENRASPEVQLLGPMPALMEKRAGRHRAQLRVLAGSRRAVHQQIRQAIAHIENLKIPPGLRWQIDIDPLESS
jgi:primosomal protein N' (replication factor Y)